MTRSTADSVTAVVDALGGSEAFRARYQISSQTLWNWRAAGRFPPTYHAAMAADLDAAGFDGWTGLWRQVTTEAAE